MILDHTRDHHATMQDAEPVATATDHDLLVDGHDDPVTDPLRSPPNTSRLRTSGPMRARPVRAGMHRATR